MATKEYHLHNGQKGTALAIRVIPRAAENQVAEILNDGTVKVRLNSSSDLDEINETLVRFLAEILKVSKNKIEIVAGLNARSKLVSILELDASTCQARIIENIA